MRRPGPCLGTHPNTIWYYFRRSKARFALVVGREVLTAAGSPRRDRVIASVPLHGVCPVIGDKRD